MLQDVVALPFAAQAVRKGRFPLILLPDQHEVPDLELLQHAFAVIHAVGMLQHPMFLDVSVAGADVVVLLLGELEGTEGGLLS